jgi:hypothetical protein
MRPDDQQTSTDLPKSMPLEKQFLGPEFLTWLYYFLETREWAVPIAELGNELQSRFSNPEALFAPGQKVQLKAADGSNTKVALSGTGLDGSGELHQAIRRGAFIETLGLMMALDGQVYSCIINGADGSLSGVKLPNLLADGETDEENSPAARSGRRISLPVDEVVFLRAAALDDIEKVLDGLFSIFLTRRLAQAFMKEDLGIIRQTVHDSLSFWAKN